MSTIGPSPLPGAAALIGRDRELSRIGSFLANATTDGDRLVFSGQPGVGKTVLLEAAIASASPDTKVLRANGVQFESEMSFAGLHQLLRPLFGVIAHRDQAVDGTLAIALGLEDGPKPQHDIVSQAAAALLRAEALSAPVLLVIDDLHWLDHASSATMEFIARHVPGSRMGVLAAFRSHSGVAGHWNGLVDHELSPLAPSASAALLSQRHPHLPAQVRRRVLDQAQGNPLALVELPVAMDRRTEDAAAIVADHLPLTRRLQQLYASSISEMPESTRNVLLLAALGAAQAAAGHDAYPKLVPAVRARLVTIEDTTGLVAFRHPLVRAAVVENSTAAERRAAHRALAMVLDDAPDRRAWHLAHAAVDPDEDVAVLLENVAERSRRRGDPVGAAAALAAAADMTPDPHHRARRIARAAYLGADVTGDLTAATQLLAQADEIDPGSRASLQSAMTAAYVALNGHGDFDFAHRTLTAAINDCLERGEHDGEDLLEAIHNLLELCLYGARPELWSSYFSTVNRHGLAGAPMLRLWTLTMADPARTAKAGLDQLQAEIASLDDERDPTRIERVTGATIFVDRLRLPSCRAALWRVIENARRGEAAAAAINAITLLTVDDFRTGRWEEVLSLTEEGITLAEGSGYQLLSRPLQMARALVAAARGDEYTTERVSAAISRWASHTGAERLREFAHHARALSALGRGDFEQAFQHAAAVSPAGVFAENVAHALWIALDLVEAAVRADRLTEAAAHVEAMRALHLDELSPRLALVVAGASAMVADDSAFDTAFARALSVPDAAEWPFEHARIELFYGERLRRARAIARARRHLESALTTFIGLGAAPWITRAQAELQATGHRSAHREQSSASGLTPQELLVADLAAAGLTNRQIAQRLSISPRTVGAHMQRIFPKLDINSRAALRAALTALGEPVAGEMRRPQPEIESYD